MWTMGGWVFAFEEMIIRTTIIINIMVLSISFMLYWAKFLLTKETIIFVVWTTFDNVLATARKENIIAFLSDDYQKEVFLGRKIMNNIAME